MKHYHDIPDAVKNCFLTKFLYSKNSFIELIVVVNDSLFSNSLARVIGNRTLLLSLNVVKPILSSSSNCLTNSITASLDKSNLDFFCVLLFFDVTNQPNLKYQLQLINRLAL